MFLCLAGALIHFIIIVTYCARACTQVEAEKYRIYKAFMFVPTSIVKRLAAQAQKRLDQMQNLTDCNDEFDERSMDEAGTGPGNTKSGDCEVCLPFLDRYHHK